MNVFGADLCRMVESCVPIVIDRARTRIASPAPHTLSLGPSVPLPYRQGLSAVLNNASRGVEANIRPESERSTSSLLTPPRATTADDPHASGDSRLSEAAQDPRAEKEDGAGVDAGKGEGPLDGRDPFDRIGEVALTSLAGSLKLLSTAVAGVGDAVFQAGMLAEGLAGGTGQVAGTSVAFSDSLGCCPAPYVDRLQDGTKSSETATVSLVGPPCIQVPCDIFHRHTTFAPTFSHLPLHRSVSHRARSLLARGLCSLGAEVRWLG